MSEIDAIVAFRAIDRPVVHGECHRITLPQRHDLGPALHAWPLLGKHKLAAGEIASGSESRIAPAVGKQARQRS